MAQLVTDGPENKGREVQSTASPEISSPFFFDFKRDLDDFVFLLCVLMKGETYGRFFSGKSVMPRRI